MSAQHSAPSAESERIRRVAVQRPARAGAGSIYEHTPEPAAGLSPAYLLALQSSAGNLAVQRLLPAPEAGAPVVQRFGAEPHEQITASALGGRGYSRRELEDIQLGNWATDMNQISLVVPHLSRYLHFNLTPAEQFLVVQLLAVGRFGEAAARRMSPARLGSYQAAEHFDNPALPSVPQEERAVASHIAPGGALPAGQTGIGQIEHNLSLAVDSGRGTAGLQYYGRATHITEDFFAHTNFVRIAMRLLDPSRAEPYGGSVAEGADAGRMRLTSGVFATADTVMSILHLLLAEVTKPPVPGEITSGDRIILMLVNHLSPALGTAFNAFLQVRSVVSPALRAAGEALLPGLALRNQARELARRALEAALAAVSAEVGQRVTGTGPQPSHTRMAIDDPTAGAKLYSTASALAAHVVAQLDPLMQAAWSAAAGQPREDARRALFARLRALLVHPDQDRWWEGIVRAQMR